MLRRLLSPRFRPRSSIVSYTPHVQSFDSVRSIRFSSSAPTATVEPKSRIPHWLLKQHIVAKPGFNRWRIPVASVSIHLCIGSVYAWSMFNTSLTKELGVVAPAAEDWTLGQVVPVFSTAIVFLGLSAAIAGHWLEKVGPRMVGVTSAACWGGGFLIGGLGIHLHQLPLLYLGYGALGGCGLGLGYVSPVSNLIRWFPDRRGMATGLAIMGFGGGAMIGAPIKSKLLNYYSRPPHYLGEVENVTLVNEGGRRFAEVSPGNLKEVVVASHADIAHSNGLLEGVYLVGTGSTGAAATFFTLGTVYFGVIMCGAFAYRVPAEGWTPPGWTPPPQLRQVNTMITQHHVHIDQAPKTPQFWFLWTVLCCNVTAGIGVLGVAKTMMDDIFGTTLPDIVTAQFTATYVLMISVFNMVGRLGWASLSDVIGRKATYCVFFGLGIPLYCSLPFAAGWVSTAPSVTPLIMFYASTMIIFSMYGGGFATIPAYLADVFGTKFVGGIHGRLLTAWSTAGVLGPMAITQLRAGSARASVHDLANKVDPVVFKQTFGSPITDLEALVASKTVSIPKLMEIAPAGTVDPTPTLYDTTMYSMAGLLCIALLANLSVRPVDPHHFMELDEAQPAEGDERKEK